MQEDKVSLCENIMRIGIVDRYSQRKHFSYDKCPSCDPAPFGDAAGLRAKSTIFAIQDGPCIPCDSGECMQNYVQVTGALSNVRDVVERLEEVHCFYNRSIRTLLSRN